jgi:Domain of unknown function (DUF4359)
MKISILLILVILLATAVGLAATNPTTEQYTVFLESSLSRALGQMDQADSAEITPDKKLIRDLLKSQGTNLIRSLTRSNTLRRDFGLFSIFETSAFGVRIQVLGIAQQFVPLEDEKELVRKLGRLMM